MSDQLFGGKSIKKPKILKSTKAGLNFPVARILRLLKKGKFGDRIAAGTPVFLAAVLEYLATEILDLAHEKATNVKRKRITSRHIMLGVRDDEELSVLLKNVDFYDAGVVPFVHKSLFSKRGVSSFLLKKKSQDKVPKDKSPKTNKKEVTLERPPSDEEEDDYNEDEDDHDVNDHAEDDNDEDDHDENDHDENEDNEDDEDTDVGENADDSGAALLSLS